MGAAAADKGRVIGRYVVYDEIASGGMATVHLARLVGAVGFQRTVAIKKLLSSLVKDAEFTAMFLDEARLAARIRHPNVVGVLDVVHEGDELLLVMEYVPGESLARLVRATRPGIVPTRIAVAIAVDVLHGLHAAHEATTEQGEPLFIVHRDVSPQNVIVGTDGVSRVFDFGIAKAANRLQTTRDGAVKGKLQYMAPEQLLSEEVDRRADIYACAVMLWESLTGEQLFEGDNQGRVIRKILDEPVPAPSHVVAGLPRALDDAVMTGIERDRTKRWPTARAFASALERCLAVASPTEIGEWVESLGGHAIEDRARRIKVIESRNDTLGQLATANIPLRKPEIADSETTAHPRNKLEKRTVPAAFPVMTPHRNEPHSIVPDETGTREKAVAPPLPPARPPPLSPRISDPGPGRISASPTHLTGAPPQTIAVTPLAKIEEVNVVAAREAGQRMFVIGLVLAIFGVLCVLGTLTWTLLH